MGHRKNATIGGFLGVLMLVILGPLDEFVFAALIGHLLLGFDIYISLIIGGVVGLVIFALLEVLDYTDII